MKATDIVGDSLAAVLPRNQPPWYRVPHLLRLNLVLVVPLLSSAANGYDEKEIEGEKVINELTSEASMMNGLLALEQWRTYFGNPHGSVLGATLAAQSIGSVVFLPVAGFLSDEIGRKKTLLLGCCVIVGASAIQAGSVKYGMFVLSRLLVGVGATLMIQPSSILISELCYPTHRGKYTSLFWCLYYLGATVAAWTTFGTREISGSWAWRIPSIVQAGLPLIQICFWWFLPESPRWLIAKNRVVESRSILSRFHIGGDDTHPLIDFEIEEITNAIYVEQVAKQTRWKSLLQTPGNRRRTLIAICVGSFSMWNGIIVVSYYLTLVMNTIGIRDTTSQTLVNGLLQIFNFLAAAGAAFLVDRLGRRLLFLWSGLGMLVSFVVWTACSAVFARTESRSLGIAVLVMVFIYNFHYDIAYTPLLFGYPTEIFPYSTRSKGVATTLISMHSSLIVLSFVIPIALENIGWHFYLVFCCLLVLICITTYLLFPETKGHSLEDIATVFDGPKALGSLSDKSMVCKESI